MTEHNAQHVTVRSMMLWRKILTGPRGDRQVWYCARSQGQTEPGAFAIWSERARDVSTGDVAGTGARI